MCNIYNGKNRSLLNYFTCRVLDLNLARCMQMFMNRNAMSNALKLEDFIVLKKVV